MEKIRKIYSLERLKSSFDKLSLKKMQKMVGFYLPIKEKGKLVWIIPQLWDGETYCAATQDNANIINSLEEIKAMLIKLLEKKK